MRELFDILVVNLTAFLVWLIARTPRPVGLIIARALVELGLMTSKKFEQTALRNLELIFPEMTTDQHKAVYRSSRNILAQNLYYFARLPYLTIGDLERMFQYADIRSRLIGWREKAGEKGLFFLCLHYGCFELMAQAHGRLDRPMTILARDFGLRRLDRWWKTRRELYGNKVFSRAGGFKEMLSNLNRGNDVSVLIDQNVKQNHAIFVSFFGIPAATSRGIGIAALRSGAPVIVCASIARGEDLFEMMAEEVPNPQMFAGSPDEQVKNFLEEVHRVIEKFIRRAPDHWFWIHRRFKTRPPGESESLYDSK